MDGTGSSALGVTVYALKLRDAEATIPDGNQLSWYGARREDCGRDDGYQFEFGELAPGTYAVGVTWGRNFDVESIQRIDVGLDPVVARLSATWPDPRSVVRVQLKGPDGRRIRNARFRVVYVAQGLGGAWVTRGIGDVRGAFLGEDGTFDVVLFRAPSSRFRIEAACSGIGVRRTRVVESLPQECVLDFEPPGTLTVDLCGRVDKAVMRSLSVGLRPVGENRDELGGQSIGFGEGERVGTVVGIQPGDYTLSLTVTQPQEHRDRGPVGLSLVTADVTVRPGVNREFVDVPELHSVRVQGALGMVVVRRLGDVSWEFGARANEGGDLEFLGIPVGDYVVFANGERRRVNVTRDERVEFVE